MNLKETLAYKVVKAAYLKYVHFICDANRNPLVNPLKDVLFRLDFRGRTI